MSIIQIVEQDHILVVDSRLIATDLGIRSDNFRELIEDHQVKMEARFGVFRFETAKPLKGSRGGRPEKFYWLTELQATAALTLVSNTDRAVDLKFDLVEKFDTAKKLLSQLVVLEPVEKKMTLFDLDLLQVDLLEQCSQLEEGDWDAIVLALDGYVPIQFWKLIHEDRKFFDFLKQRLSKEHCFRSASIAKKFQTKFLSSSSGSKAYIDFIQNSVPGSVSLDVAENIDLFSTEAEECAYELVDKCFRAVENPVQIARAKHIQEYIDQERLLSVDRQEAIEESDRTGESGKSGGGFGGKKKLPKKK